VPVRTASDNDRRQYSHHIATVYGGFSTFKQPRRHSGSVSPIQWLLIVDASGPMAILQPSRYLYIDQTGKRIDFVEPDSLGAISDGIFTLRDQDRLRLYSGEAIAQCDTVFGTTYFADYTILRDQVVIRDAP
jgi:hypothetical protein